MGERAPITISVFATILKKHCIANCLTTGLHKMNAVHPANIAMTKVKIVMKLERGKNSERSCNNQPTAEMNVKTINGQLHATRRNVQLRMRNLEAKVNVLYLLLY